MLNIKLEKFDGPLSLLLRLIEKEEMDITQVSIAQVADQFVDYLRALEEIDPELMADFLVVASKLLLIKTKALLPYLYSEEEDEEVEDFELQLKMYKEFIQASKKIEKILGTKKFMFAREFNRKVVLNNINFFAPPKKLEKNDLENLFLEIIGRLRPVEKLEEKTLDKKISIDDKILSIQNILMERIKFSFNKVLKEAKNKTEIVVSFLAVLELMRQREIVLSQEGLFTEILIQRIEK
jgi:segregation and condensation protein A